MTTERAGAKERRWIDAYFAGESGRFLEIGSFDGITDSLTNGLIQSGWSGVMVEPNPHIFDALLANHGANSAITLVHAAVAENGGLTPFWDREGESQTSSIDERFVADDTNQARVRKYLIRSTTVPELIQYFRGPRNWQLVVIDAEGVGEELALALPHAQMVDTQILCVEYYKHKDEMIDRLLPWYRVAEIIHPNVILERKS